MISMAVFGVAIFLLLSWSSDELSFDPAEWWLLAIWAIAGVALVGLQVRRIATKMVWAILSPDGVSNSDGEKLAWDEISEIRFVLGEIWIGQNDQFLPFVSLTARVIGKTQLDRAERYLRKHAPVEKIKKL